MTFLYVKNLYEEELYEAVNQLVCYATYFPIIEPSP